MSEEQYRSLLVNGALLECKHTVKILPDDSELQDHPQYQEVKKAYKKALKLKETMCFELTTNK